MPEKYAIITAGGRGVRMNTPLPKQFLPLAGRPVLMHTIDAFLSIPSPIEIILVIPIAHFSLWKQLCQEHNFHPDITLAEGGPTRFHSVKNGLKHVPDKSIVAIHDGVRPLVSQRSIEDAYYMAERFGNAIPAVTVNESVRIVEHAFNKPVNRDSLRIIQTPQCFRADLIKKAYETAYNENFTDDASVLEKQGERIYLSEGNRENIKITTTEDLAIAEALLKR